jgi:hypothetical protein
MSPHTGNVPGRQRTSGPWILLVNRYLDLSSTCVKDFENRIYKKANRVTLFKIRFDI